MKYTRKSRGIFTEESFKDAQRRYAAYLSDISTSHGTRTKESWYMYAGVIERLAKGCYKD